MLRPLALAALVLASPALVASVKAQTAASTVFSPTGSTDQNMAGTTTRMFIINATTPGALTFSGAGTATFNNAVGTSNQFNVGSNTSIGVNASVSATPEFDGKALGLMQLTGGSNLNQSNGTASSASSTQAAAQAANDVATQTAQEKSHKTGWEEATKATAVAGTKSGNFGSYDQAGDWKWNDTQYQIGSSGQYTGTTTQTQESKDYQSFKNAYTTSYNNTYNDNYSSTYKSVIASSSSSASAANATGIIKGTFKSTEDSVSSVGQSSTMTNVANSALSAANTAGGITTESGKAAFLAAFNAGYQNSIGSVKTTSSSDVTIEGLGAIANVKSNDASMFKVDLNRLSAYAAVNTQTNATATANGSSASTLSTNSFATQNNQRTASAFMQAFAAAPTAPGIGSATVVDMTNGKVYQRELVGSFATTTAPAVAATATTLAIPAVTAADIGVIKR